MATRLKEKTLVKTIAVELPDTVSAELDVLVENGWFASQSEIVRAALWEFVRRNRFALAEEFQRADIAWALQQHRSRKRQPPAAP